MPRQAMAGHLEQWGKCRRAKLHRAGLCWLCTKQGSSSFDEPAKQGSSFADERANLNVYKKKRYKRDELYQMITAHCTDWCSVEVLSKLAGRDQKYLRDTIIKEMLNHGFLEKKYPDTPNHPAQKYQWRK